MRHPNRKKQQTKNSRHCNVRTQKRRDYQPATCGSDDAWEDNRRRPCTPCPSHGPSGSSRCRRRCTNRLNASAAAATTMLRQCARAVAATRADLSWTTRTSSQPWRKGAAATFVRHRGDFHDRHGRRRRVPDQKGWRRLNCWWSRWPPWSPEQPTTPGRPTTLGWERGGCCNSSGRSSYHSSPSSQSPHWWSFWAPRRRGGWDCWALSRCWRGRGCWPPSSPRRGCRRGNFPTLKIFYSPAKGQEESGLA